MSLLSEFEEHCFERITFYAAILGVKLKDDIDLDTFTVDVFRDMANKKMEETMSDKVRLSLGGKPYFEPRYDDYVPTYEDVDQAKIFEKQINAELKLRSDELNEVPSVERKIPQCRYFPNCTNAECKFNHPTPSPGRTPSPAPMSRPVAVQIPTPNKTPCTFAWTCSRVGCTFDHPAGRRMDTPCSKCDKNSPQPRCGFKH